MPIDAHAEPKSHHAAATNDASDVLSKCARELVVFGQGTVQGAVKCAEEHPLNAVADAAFGVAIGLATRDCSEVAKGLIAASSIALVATEAPRIVHGDLGKIFAQTWNSADSAKSEANAARVGTILGPSAFNAFALGAFAGAGIAYNKLEFGTMCNEVGEIDATAYRRPYATTLSELRTNDHLGLTPQRQIRLERVNRPMEESKLSDYVGTFQRPSLSDFRARAERHQYLMDDKFRANPDLIQVPQNLRYR